MWPRMMSQLWPRMMWQRMMWQRMRALDVGRRHALPCELAWPDNQNREIGAVDFRSRLGYSSEVLTYQ